jgi:hypothetical protein
LRIVSRCTPVRRWISGCERPSTRFNRRISAHSSTPSNALPLVSINRSSQITGPVGRPPNPAPCGPRFDRRRTTIQAAPTQLAYASRQGYDGGCSSCRGGADGVIACRRNLAPRATSPVHAIASVRRNSAAGRPGCALVRSPAGASSPARRKESSCRPASMRVTPAASASADAYNSSRTASAASIAIARRCRDPKRALERPANAGTSQISRICLITRDILQHLDRPV